MRRIVVDLIVFAALVVGSFGGVTGMQLAGWALISVVGENAFTSMPFKEVALFVVATCGTVGGFIAGAGVVLFLTRRVWVHTLHASA